MIVVATDVEERKTNWSVRVVNREVHHLYSDESMPQTVLAQVSPSTQCEESTL